MSTDYINYHKIIDTAMRGVVRNVLATVARDGIQGEHDLFISFLTNAHGVNLSDRMKAKYPSEIKIELQHQFSDLKADEEFFTVMLSFGGISEVIVVPYKAITSFEDHGTKFSLEFSYHHEISSDIAEEVSENEPSLTKETESVRSNVIILDKFRKNKK
jgi:hypothetical protein